MSRREAFRRWRQQRPFWGCVFTLVFANFFDAMGTFTGLSREAGLADDRGTFPRLRSALIVEGAGAVVGGASSASSNTVFIESGAGIGEGARTGFANVVTGALFLVAMFFTPLVSIVPTEVAASALVIVGALMMSQIRFIERPFCERLGTPFAVDLGQSLVSPAAMANSRCFTAPRPPTWPAMGKL